MIIRLEVWQRVLIGGAVGVVGIILYAAMRLIQETTEKWSWLGTFGIAAFGMVLVGVADWILKPVSVASWLRWTIIVASGALSLASFAGLRYVVSDDDDLPIALVFYIPAMFFALLAVTLLVREIS